MTLHVTDATDQARWDGFLTAQRFRPFLQSWTMGEVYRAVHQEPIRLEAKDGDQTVGICFAHLVPARRGRHLSIPYGPIVARPEAIQPLIDRLKEIGTEKGCSFLRLSPFIPKSDSLLSRVEGPIPDSKPSPLHLLAEHLWYLPLTTTDAWLTSANHPTMVRPSSPQVQPSPLTPEDLQKNMRSTTRNLIRRAAKDGVTIRPSADPLTDLSLFITLHEETRKRHGFTPYTNAFFRAQVAHFAPRGELTMYLAEYGGEVIAASIHMHMAGETSYHHGASTHRFSKIPASYLLQWTAIQDALKRGDHVYNFWGIAPQSGTANGQLPTAKHPFAGVTLFKTGFGGNMLELTHCMDIPLSPKYHLTRAFEQVRKWRRGF
jgi:lipid II:glycine glycyltransferase (peptidoglycan interpeptide bridge formation enzyme)